MGLVMSSDIPVPNARFPNLVPNKNKPKGSGETELRHYSAKCVQGLAFFLIYCFPSYPHHGTSSPRDKKHCQRPYNLPRHDEEIQYSLLTDTLVLQVITVLELWHFNPCTDFLCSYAILNPRWHSLDRLVSFIQSKISHSKSTNPCSVFYTGFCSSVESAFTNTPSLGMWKAKFLTLGLLNARKIILLLWPMFGYSLHLPTALFKLLYSYW